MVTVVVLADFTDGDVSYQKGDVVSVPEAQYKQWAAKNWVGPTSDPVNTSWVGPTSDGQ